MDTESYSPSLHTTTALARQMGDLLATRINASGKIPQPIAESANDRTSAWRIAFDAYNVTGEALWDQLSHLPEYLRATALQAVIEQAAIQFYTSRSNASTTTN